MKALGITFLSIAGLSFILILCIFKKIQRAIRIMKVTNKIK